MKGKILIVDDLHPIFKESANAMGFEVHDRPLITRAETLDIIADYDGIAVRTKFKIDKELMQAGAPVLHFYTMSNPEPTKKIAQAIF